MAHLQLVNAHECTTWQSVIKARLCLTILGIKQKDILKLTYENMKPNHCWQSSDIQSENKDHGDAKGLRLCGLCHFCPQHPSRFQFDAYTQRVGRRSMSKCSKHSKLCSCEADMESRWKKNFTAQHCTILQPREFHPGIVLYTFIMATCGPSCAWGGACFGGSATGVLEDLITCRQDHSHLPILVFVVVMHVSNEKNPSPMVWHGLHWEKIW